MEDKLTKQLNIAIGIVFLAAAGVLAYSAVHRQAETQKTDESPAAQQPEAPKAAASEYDALKGMKEVKIAEEFESWTPDAKLDPTKTKSISLIVKGEVAGAYLLTKASEGGNGLTKYDSEYFKLNDAGGHLFRPLSLKVPDGPGTTLLYDLKDVPYLASVPYSEERRPDHDDLLALLKDGKTVLATSFISSMRQSTLDEVSIYYACAKGSDCSIAVK